MKRLLLLALPILLAACPKTPEAGDATPTQAAATPADTATSTAAAAVTPAIEFATPGAIRTAALLPTRRWDLVSAHDAAGQPIAALTARPGTPVTLEFREGAVQVGNTCNAMQGPYKVEGSAVVVDKLASTRKACADAALMALDGEIGKRLEGKLGVRMSKGAADHLELKTATGDVLVFKGAERGNAKYDGPGERVFLEVAAQTKACSHPLVPDKQCLQVREVKYDAKGLPVGTPGEFRNFYDEIKGYTHAAGVRNVLRVDRYKVKNPPADAPSVAYVLDMVVTSDTSGK